MVKHPFLTELASLLHEGSGELAVRRGGVQVEIPLSVRDVLTRIADVLASGRGVAVLPVDRELTTTEAAGLLGVSRPTLIKLLEAGEIGYSDPRRTPTHPDAVLLDLWVREPRILLRVLGEQAAGTGRRGTRLTVHQVLDYLASAGARRFAAAARPSVPPVDDVSG